MNRLSRILNIRCINNNGIKSMNVKSGSHTPRPYITVSRIDLIPGPGVNWFTYWFMSREWASLAGYVHVRVLTTYCDYENS